jgi:hypothetical protein
MNIDQWIAEQRSRFPDFDEESARQMASMPFYANMLGIDPPDQVQAGGIRPDQIQLLNLGAGINQQLMAINPKTGQPEPVKIDYGPNADSQSAPIAYYFGNDGPQSASLARAGGYSSGNDSAFGGLGDFLGKAAAATSGLQVGGASGASAATGNGINQQTVAADAAGLGAGFGLAGAGLGTAAAPAAGGATGATAPAIASGGQALGSGLTAATGTGEVMGTGGTLSGGAFSSAGGGGLTMGGTGMGLSVTPEASMAAGFGGATGAGGAAASTAGSGSLLDWLGGSMGKSVVGGALGNALVNGALGNRAQHQASDLAGAQNPMNDPRRAPFQDAATNMVQNPQDYMANNPFAKALGDYYRNGVIPAQFARSGNAGEVIDRNGSQFATSIANNYNGLLGQLQGFGGFNQTPQVNGVPQLLSQSNGNIGEATRGLGDAAGRIFGDFAKSNAWSGTNLMNGGGADNTNPITGTVNLNV